MTSQLICTWIFLLGVVLSVVVLAAWLPGRALVQYLFAFGVVSAFLDVLYLVLAATLPTATAQVPHTHLWTPELVQAMATALAAVTVGFLTVWVALGTAEQAQRATFDASEAEIFGAARAALASLQAALRPFHVFLDTDAARAGRQLLTAAWTVPLGGPRLGAHLYQAGGTIDGVFTAGRLRALTRTLVTAEQAWTQVQAAQYRVGWTFDLPGWDRSGLDQTGLDGDLGLLRDVLDWAEAAAGDGPDAAMSQSRLVFLLARAAAAQGSVAGQPWLGPLLDGLEPDRTSDLPPEVPDQDQPELELVSGAWTAQAEVARARPELIQALDRFDPARTPSRAGSARSHARLWDLVLSSWREQVAATSPPAVSRPGPGQASRTFQGPLAGTGGQVTITVPAPEDSPLTQEARAAGLDGPLVLGRLDLARQWRAAGGPDLVYPIDVRLWAVTSEARWHLLPLATDVIEQPGGSGRPPGSPLAESVRVVTAGSAAETLWCCPVPLVQARWWVASWSEPGGDRRELRETGH